MCETEKLNTVSHQMKGTTKHAELLATYIRFWNWHGHGGGFCEKLREASPCPMEPEPVGSEMDPLLAKAEPISNGDSASGKTY